MDMQSPEVRRFMEKQASSEALSLKVLADLPKEFRDIARDIEDISGNWNAVEIFEPDGASIKSERAAFMEALDWGREYVPQFTYGKAEKMELGDSRGKLQVLMDRILAWEPQSHIERLSRVMLRAKLLDDLATCDLVEGIQKKDDALIRAAMNQKYPALDDAVLREEEKALDIAINLKPAKDLPAISTEQFTPAQAEALKNRFLTPEEQKEFFEWALKAYGLLRTEANDIGFRVVVDEHAQALDVRHRSAEGPTIFIPAKAIGHDPFSMYEAITLLRHEIEGHARQTANGQALFGLRGALTLDDETLYEGLAMRLERDAMKRYFGEAEDPDPRFYAHAVLLAEKGEGFAGIFRNMYDKHLHILLHIPMDRPLPEAIDAEYVVEARRIAWRTTYRVLRGHTDLSNKEAFAMRKDIGYERGLRMDAELIANGKGHYNEVAVIAKGGLALLGEFRITPEDLPYKDKNLTADFVRALKEGFAQQTVFDMQEFVRKQSIGVFGSPEFDALG